MWPFGILAILRTELSQARIHASSMANEVDTLAARLGQAEGQALAYRDRCDELERQLAKAQQARDAKGRYIRPY